MLVGLLSVFNIEIIMFGYFFKSGLLPIFKSRTVYLQNTHSFRHLGIAGSYCPWVLKRV